MTTSRCARVSLRVTPRAILELGNIYPDPESVVKEFIQNAVDANATEMHIFIDEDKHELVFRHNGEPITGEYLEAFLTVGTDFKVKRGGMIGMYGIGRLAWTMIGEEAWIRTGDKIMYWSAKTPEDLMNIEIEEADSWFDGVEWRIKLKDNVMIDPVYLKNRLGEVYYGSVPLYVNGDLVSTERRLGKLLLDLGDTRVYLDKGSARLEGSIIKGIFRVGTEWAFQRLIVVTENPNVKINAARVIVRDVNYEDWKRRIMKALLAKLPEIYPDPGDLVEDVGMDAIKRWHREIYWYVPYDRKEAVRYVTPLVFETGEGYYVYGRVIAENPGKFVYSTVKVDDSTRIRVKNMGYTIIYADDDYELKEAFKILGVKRIEEVIASEEVKIITDDQDVADILRSVVAEVGVVFRVRASKRKKEKADGNGDETVITTTIASEGQSKVVGTTTSGRTVKFNMVNVKFVGRIPKTPIVLVEHENEHVVAFTNGSNIFINIRNEENIKRLDLTRKLKGVDKNLIIALWAPVIIHEMLHMYGFDHRDPEWHQLYEYAMARIIMDCIEKHVASK